MSLTGVLIAPVANGAPDVIVVTDDQLWDDLVVMRTVTGMLSQSVQFMNAFVTTSECAPSRASLLSGRYAHNHGVRTLDGTLFVGPDMSTLATWLHARRYRTAMVGKY
jgi:arylsulfatase A-like enzyme